MGTRLGTELPGPQPPQEYVDDLRGSFSCLQRIWVRQRFFLSNDRRMSAHWRVDLQHSPVRRSDLTPCSGHGGDRLAAASPVPSRLGQRSGAANHRTKIFRVYRFAPDHKLINLEAANA
jgi:hypothetical protein